MLEPLVERVSLAQIHAVLGALECIGQDALLSEARREAESFFAGLALHRRSRAYLGRLRVREAVPSAVLVERLHQAAAAFHGAEPDLFEVETLFEFGVVCSRLASSIGAAMEAPHPADLGVLVQIDLDGRGRGELVLVPLTPEEREAEERRRQAERQDSRRRKGSR